MIAFRNIKQSDYSVIAGFFESKKELQSAFYQADFPADPKQLGSIIESRSNAVIITYNDIPVGFSDLYNIKEKEECCIGNFIIDKNNRQRGFASTLLQENIAQAIKLYNVKKIKIFCRCENTEALILYSKFGFQPCEMFIREFDSVKVPVLLLEKRINV